jgi:hypothetical protein
MRGTHKIKFYIFMGLFFSGISYLMPDSSESLSPTSPKKNEKQIPALNLLGVIVSENASFSLAVLKDKSIDEVVIVKMGENISGLELINVFKNRIILQKKNETFQIFLKRTDPNFQARNNKRKNKTRSSNVTKNRDIPSGYQAPPGVYSQGPPGAQMAGPPGEGGYVDLTGNSPGIPGSNIQNEKNLAPQETGTIRRTPGPGEPGFQYVEQKNLVPREDPAQKKKQPKKE